MQAIFLNLTEILLIIVMAKFQESRTEGSQARFTYHENDFSGKCQRGEFVYVLWNVPIQIFAIYIFFS